MRKKLFIVLAIAALVLPLFAACAQPATPKPSAGKQGGTLVIGLYQEPETLNVAICTQTVCFEVDELVYEALVGINPQGEYIPELAAELPTVQNGGISPDGLTITYHLRDGVKWSNGEPCTCDDWKFTWEVQMDPKSGAKSTTGWKDIETVECPDPKTIVFRFKKYYAAHLQTIGGAWPFPRNASGEPAKMQEWAYNRAPIGNGPFKFVEWASGDHITLARNEHYHLWASEKKPYLDQVIFKIIPSREVGKQLIKTGEIDVLWDLVEADIPDFTDLPGVVLSAPPDTGSERLLLNLRNPEIDAPCVDRLRNEGLWHWALGDLRVRQAIRYGIDKKQLNDKLLYGKATLGTTAINIGWAKPNIPVSEYNPDKAKQLMEEAGWKDTDGDGIRECEGCLYAEKGRKLRLKIQTTSGNKLREETEQVLAEMMKNIGIELYIENVPSAELFASYASGAFRSHGRYDILMYTSTFSADPQTHMEGSFASWNIPCDENKGRGFNYYRWINDEFDKWIKIAGENPDLEKRKEAYQKASEEIDKDVPVIFLYNRLELNAYRSTLQGWVDNTWQSMGWNSQEWWLKKD